MNQKIYQNGGNNSNIYDDGIISELPVSWQAAEDDKTHSETSTNQSSTSRHAHYSRSNQA